MNPYKSIRLTAEQKHNMARSIQQPSKKKKRLSVRFIIYPAFIATALFLVFLWSNATATHTTIINQSASEVFDRESPETHVDFIKHTLVLWSVSLALLIATYVVVLITAHNPRNSIYFQSIRYVNEKVKERKIFYIALMPIGILVIYSIIVLIIPWPVLVLQAIILILSVFLYFYISVFWFRKSGLEYKCPSCQKALTNKEILWRKKCGSCKNKREIPAIEAIQPVFITMSHLPFILMDFNRYLIMGYSILIILAMIKVLLRNKKVNSLK